MFKRIFSGLLLILLLFNLGGYHLVFTAMQVQANRELSVRLDEGNFSDQETITLTIPFALPYPIQETGFERTRQHFAIGDEHYQVVGQSFDNDVLTIVCVKDRESKDIADMVNAFDAQQTDASGPVSVITAKTIQEYISTQIIIHPDVAPWSRTLDETRYVADRSVGFRTIPFSPPRFV